MQRPFATLQSDPSWRTTDRQLLLGSLQVQLMQQGQLDESYLATESTLASVFRLVPVQSWQPEPEEAEQAIQNHAIASQV
jgi:hypothetical protein